MDAETLLTAGELDELQCEQRRIGAVMAVAMRVLGCALHDGHADLATQTLYKIAEQAEQLFALENPDAGEGAGEAGAPALH